MHTYRDKCALCRFKALSCDRSWYFWFVEGHVSSTNWSLHQSILSHMYSHTHTQTYMYTHTHTHHRSKGILVLTRSCSLCSPEAGPRRGSSSMRLEKVMVCSRVRVHLTNRVLSALKRSLLVHTWYSMQRALREASCIPPSQNFEVDIFLILSSSLVANFRTFWSPRSNLRTCKFQKFPAGENLHTP